MKLFGASLVFFLLFVAGSLVLRGLGDGITLAAAWPVLAVGAIATVIFAGILRAIGRD